MSLPDISNLSLPELTDLISTAENLVLVKKADNIKNIKAQMEELAAQSGMTVQEVLGLEGSKSTAGKRAKVAPKYQNPADASMTWTGRGRKPAWVLEALAADMTLDDIAI